MWHNPRVSTQADERGGGDETRPEPAQKSNTVGRVLLAIVILLSVYVLSIGPAYKLYRKGTLSDTAFNVVYGPLMKLSAVSPLFNRSVQWYLREVWGVRY